MTSCSRRIPAPPCRGPRSRPGPNYPFGACCQHRLCRPFRSPVRINQPSESITGRRDRHWTDTVSSHKCEGWPVQGNRVNGFLVPWLAPHGSASKHLFYHEATKATKFPIKSANSVLVVRILRGFVVKFLLCQNHQCAVPWDDDRRSNRSSVAHPISLLVRHGAMTKIRFRWPYGSPRAGTVCQSCEPAPLLHPRTPDRPGDVFLDRPVGCISVSRP